MTRCKTFGITTYDSSFADVATEINTWLSENPGITINTINVFSLGNSVYPTTCIMVIYEEPKSKVVTYLKGEKENV